MKNKTKIPEPINCEEAASRFNDFMDNFLKGKAKEELVHHIAQCRHCFDRFEFEQLLKSKIHLLAENEKNSSLVKRIEKMIASL